MCFIQVLQYRLKNFYTNEINSLKKFYDVSELQGTK